ncbi:MAG: histidine phosphatase family protein [Dehalococcoidia bacterium]|nr:histidine phosphatase family protein [Dehalococcoidia bacterium]
MRLILVRHGETKWNREGRFQGQSQVKLNDRGVEQARKVASALVSWKPTALYSSPLPRTMMTASMVSNAVNLPVEPKDGLKEVNLGVLEGITGKMMRTNYADLYESWREDPSDVVFPEGESIRQLQTRAWRTVEEMEDANAEGTVVAVSHNFAIRAMLCACLGLPLPMFHRLRVDLASISVVSFSSDSPQVLTINERCHLDSVRPK